MLHKTPIAFGMALLELCWPLSAGASLCLLEPGHEHEPVEIIKAIQLHQVTVLHFFPAALNAFLNSTRKNFYYSYLDTLRRVFSSGEPLTPQPADLFGRTLHTYCRTALVHLYGPDEAALPVAHYPVGFDRKYNVVPAGRPAAGARLCVLDPDGHPVPAGMPGELWVSDAGRPAERRPTGDLARWNGEGSLELLGRRDDLVRLKGYTLSAQHLETALVRLVPLLEAAAVVAEVDGKSCLVVYYRAEREMGSGAVEALLAGLLPPAVRPAYAVAVDQMPLTFSGRTDKSALAAYKRAEWSSGIVAAANPTEKKLVELWADVFGTEEHEISVEDNFFRMGMQSLDSTRFIFKVRQAFATDISLKKLFQYSTIRSLSEYIRSGSPREADVAPAADGPVKFQVKI
jgi:acyl-coenzyme A synthetase/AMP-(fatty) acid ligase/acyl carrier protein